MFPPYDLKSQTELVVAAIAEFPDTFGLRAFPGETFKIVESASYYDHHGGNLYLYTFCHDVEADKWRAFSKGSPAELRRELVAAPAPPTITVKTHDIIAEIRDNVPPRFVTEADGGYMLPGVTIYRDDNAGGGWAFRRANNYGAELPHAESGALDDYDDLADVMEMARQALAVLGLVENSKPLAWGPGARPGLPWVKVPGEQVATFLALYSTDFEAACNALAEGIDDPQQYRLWSDFAQDYLLMMGHAFYVSDFVRGLLAERPATGVNLLNGLVSLLICAFEGGSNYWACRGNVTPAGIALRDVETGELYTADYARVWDAVDSLGAGDAPPRWHRGIQGEIAEPGSGDATTGDNWLQLVMFGEVQFG